ncbi:amino acid ABC transporter permease [Roseomonas indoligenes]|uniref:Amino acid ABC transporter permease n=1 Tax=Roseomonas indoligenes TaxID=2820811 RepID=A0A940MR38_9PROT|nr:amino acid ABC transporter permease [Pararoseomonas indoligenes]MBP0491929.1 amino acid ABC transporter permease [Pararoseomonas indoligenes]
MDWAFVEEALPPLLRGAVATVAVSLAGIALGFAAGAAIAAASTAASRGLRGAAALYISFFRGVPLLVQLLLAYYALPFLGIDIPAIVAAVGTLGLCCAAYMAEILRGGLATVPPGAVEAARLLGLTRAQTFLRIRLPIAARTMRPAIVGEAIMIMKASSLISLVGIMELTRTSQALASSTFMPLQSYALCGGIYLVINFVLMAVGWDRKRA